MTLDKLPFLLVLLISINTATADDTPLTTNITLLNAIHSDEIKTIMQRLNILVHEREYTEFELQKLNSRKIKLLAEQVSVLAETATNLPNIASLKDLDEEQQATFSAMVNELNDITQELIRETDAGHKQKADAAFLKLQATCHTCHKIFRDRY